MWGGGYTTGGKNPARHICLPSYICTYDIASKLIKPVGYASVTVLFLLPHRGKNMKNTKIPV